MKARLVLLVAVLLGFAKPVFAHWLDEYLQATTVNLARSSIVLQLRLTPGVDMVPAVLPWIDADGDGVFSEAEQRSYAERVARDLLLAVDGEPLSLRLVSSSFPPAGEMTSGAGTIQLEFAVSMPPGGLLA